MLGEIYGDVNNRRMITKQLRKLITIDLLEACLEIYFFVS
jgi:hypothetical protein